MNPSRPVVGGLVRLTAGTLPPPNSPPQRLDFEWAILAALSSSTLSAGTKKADSKTIMKTDSETSALRKNSPLFWCTLLVPIGIIAIGINFILNPVGASTAYGIPIQDPTAFPFMWIKGIRDIFSGLVILPFLLRGDRRTTATLYALAIFIPVCDGLVILSRLGFAPPIYIHWGTALYMTVVAALLFRKGNSQVSPPVA
jgi:hypothetical protein